MLGLQLCILAETYVKQRKKPYAIEQQQGLHRNSLYFPQTFVQ